MNPLALGAAALAAWFLLKKKAVAAPATQSRAKPKPKPKPKPKAKEVDTSPPTVTPVVAPAPAVKTWPVLTVQKVKETYQKPPVAPPELRDNVISTTRPAVITAPAQAIPQTEEAAVIARERSPNDRSYWMYVQKVTAQEGKAANELLKTWKQGAISFNGPRSFKGRRMFKAVMHGTKRAVEVFQPKPPFV